MIGGTSVLAVIPARGGSKRAPRKNIREFRGKPLIQWALEAAQSSDLINTIVLSSEDEEILAWAFSRCRVVKRPEMLATDDATNEDVLRDVLRGWKSDWVVLLQPTSPLRTGEDIDACIRLAQRHGAAVSYRPDGTKNGAVYVASFDWIMEHDFTHQDHAHYVMPDERSLDIDYPEQFE